MKSLEELKAIREKMKRQMDLRENDENSIRVVVGMATKRGASACAAWSRWRRCSSPARRK